jgi:predicted phosphodiesterase
MSRLQRIGIIPDTHWPYEDSRAYSCCLHALRDFKPDVLVHLGDAVDFYSISDFGKDPQRRTDVKFEIDYANNKLRELERLFPNARKVMLWGNHEDRWRRNVLWNETYKSIIGLIDIDGLFGYKEHGWEVVPYGKYIRFGKLVFAHGHATSSGHAAKMLADYGHSTVYGHLHAMQLFTRINALGEEMVAACPGWLGALDKIDYMKKIPQWCHGFATVYVADDGLFWLNLIKIIRGKCVMNGKMFSPHGIGWTVRENL